MRRFLGCLALGFAFGLLVTPLVHAQAGTGRISGLVKDASGGVVPGVTILAVHEETGVKHETVTTEDCALMQTSCVEVYRLSAWRLAGRGKLTITEDVLQSSSATATSRAR